MLAPAAEVYCHIEYMNTPKQLDMALFPCRAPDAAKIKAKMMYASTKDFFKGFLDGLSVEMQANDVGDISEQDVSEAVRSSTTRQ